MFSRACFGFAGFVEETIQTMYPRPKVVKEPLNLDESTFKLPPPEPISENTARQILAGQLVKVAGPEPFNWWAAILVAAVITGLLAVVYSMAVAR